MLDWSRVRAAKLAEAKELRDVPLSEVVPSRRDFGQFIPRGRGEVAVIATIRRLDPYSGAHWPDLDVARVASELDDADVAGLAVTTEPVLHAGRLEDLDAASQAATAGLLRDELLLHPADVYRSRMHGADACVLAVGWVSDAELHELVRIAHSVHMTPVLAAATTGEVQRALAHERDLIGIWAQSADGRIDMPLARELAAGVPRRQAVILLGDVVDAAQWPELGGVVDAALLARAMMGAEDPVSALAAYE